MSILRSQTDPLTRISHGLERSLARVRARLHGKRCSLAVCVGAAVVLCVVAQACGPQGPEVYHSRPLIEQGRYEVLSRDDLITAEEVIAWPLSASAPVSEWTVNLSAHEYTWTQNGLDVHADRRFLTLTRDVDLNAGDADSCRFVVNGFDKKPMSLEWAREGEEFAEERKLSVDEPSAVQTSRETYSFLLRGHPEWSGTIRRVRFSFVLPKSCKGFIHNLAFVNELLDSDAVARAAQKTWKIDVGNDRRLGWLAVPGLSARARIEDPRGKRLAIAIGDLGGVGGSFAVRVVARPESGASHVLAEQTVVVAPEAWSALEVDLGAMSDEAHDLVFETLTGPDSNESLTIPVWGNPEVLSREEVPASNIVVISMDTLRADHLKLYGYGRNTTPNIDSWLQDHGGVVFEDVVASASWTLPSHVSIFTGIEAIRHGVNQNKPMPEAMTSMAEILKSQGYTTAAVTGGGFVHAAFGFDQGFDEYQSFSSRMGFDNEIEITTERSLAKLDRLKERRFFLFLHTYEIHNPFRPREVFLDQIPGRSPDVSVDVVKVPSVAEDGFLTHRELGLVNKGRPTDERPDDLMDLARDLYDAGIAHTDTFIGRFLHRLEELGLADDTIVVLTSDHGELFGEHGEVNHYTVYDENVLVPLMMAGPGFEDGLRRIALQVRSVDIMPTLLDWVGLHPPEGLDGQSLLDLMRGGELAKYEHQLALSYAGASNHGLSIRDPGGKTLIFRNGAWVTSRARYQRWQDGRELVGAEQTEAEGSFERLEDHLAFVMGSEMPGLRVLVRNLEGQTPLEGGLRGGPVGMGNAKVADEGSGILRREPNGSAAFEVPPGAEVRWLFEGTEPRTLFVTLDGRTYQIKASRSGAVSVLRRSGSVWKVSTAQTIEAHDGLFAWWDGPSMSSHGGSDISEDVLEQLRALGYTEG